MNHLANSSSPYLLQHANNPVDWYPWGPEALQKARDENKLILVSIGYSACHWCHVMEHESFEDESVAAVMNEYFVCIKVDREERPDVDQIYMSAVQLMTGRGGWPLNCICLPDQRPIYGGTYFRKNDWTSLLFNLADFYRNKPAEAAEYADKLTAGIKQYESVSFVKEQAAYTTVDLEKIVSNWMRYFDTLEGGMGSEPKFPMPNNWLFLMRYAYLMGDGKVTDIVKLTLRKMAYGGIYDHVGGGFARYSVDRRWHIPHFEKMLYDNAQLISVYAEAYTWQPDQLYKHIVAETIAFTERELMSPEYGFYSALDADSEGVEGKFYSFSKAELVDLLGEDADVFCIYYNVTEHGNWEEEETNVFFRNNDDDLLAEKLGLCTADLQAIIHRAKAKVLTERSKRIRPGLDNKILASWNGLMLKGLCDAYRVFDIPEYLELALKNAEFITQDLITSDNKLIRVYKKGSAEGIAFLDDYANVIDAFIALYEVTFDVQWLTRAKDLTNITIADFYDEANGIFFYTGDGDEQLIARKSEIMDGVIPSSNSVMARNLKKLSLFFDDERYAEISSQLLRNIFPLIAKYGSSYSNWAILLQEEVLGINEIAVTGADVSAVRKQLEQNYIPNKIMLGGNVENLPLLQNRVGVQTRIFICKDKTCGLPSETVDEALKQIGR
ncbi:thioredoxin domain-containing protein [Mucilaginibacter mali]|uniref:Thioredoxin domain-containing protein n=1 Tax=Mucilaginibacter mali TaxID=2740462 RepID=A0A7D4QF47_9SPHI|nr:thioredoxin domain-containing protein [Mucilaginibacter mali]QKJ30112.1 thioredoxin domain-containing protein [Mucilaginibacter mali]